MKVKILLLIINLIFASYNYFPIGAFSIRGTSQIYKADTFGLNTFHIECNDSIGDYVNIIKTLNKKMVLAQAYKPPWYSNRGYNLRRLSSSQSRRYEAEDTSLFKHETGNKIYDPEASRETAWVSYKPGWLQQGPFTLEQNQFLNFPPNDTFMDYIAYFRLKILKPSTIPIPICTIFIFKEQIPIKKLIIYSDSFNNPGFYDTFQIRFTRTKRDVNNNLKMSYSIYSCTNESLFSDYVDVLDVVADSLFKGFYDGKIREIVDTFQKLQAPIFRYYLCDEPEFDQISSSAYVIRLLRRLEAPPGIQAINNFTKNIDSFYKYYLDTTKAEELMITSYPFRGSQNGIFRYRTPEDSGILFQTMIDTVLCKRLSLARIETKKRNKNFIYTPQTFGNIVPSDTSYWDTIWNESIPYLLEGKYREPTEREARCILWLGLVYGTKGIHHFLYNTFSTKYVKYLFYWCVGVTAPNIGEFEKRWNWERIKAWNEEIKIAGEIIKNLVSDTVFKGSQIPANNIVYKTNDTLLHFGIFYSLPQPPILTQDTYIIIVNRHCLDVDGYYNFEIYFKRERPFFLLDMITGEMITPLPSSIPPIWHFEIRFRPGQGRLFKIGEE